MAQEQERNLKHIFLREHGERESFTSPLSGPRDQYIPPRNRAQHAQRLERALTTALAAAEQQILARDVRIPR